MKKAKDLVNIEFVGRFGIVNVDQALTLLGRPVWVISYRIPKSGSGEKRKWVRRRIPKEEMTLEQLKVDVCEHLTTQAYLGKGYLPDNTSKVPALAEGIAQALKLTRTQEVVRKERERLSAQFVLWMKANYPTVVTWDQMRQLHLQSYCNTLEDAGGAFDTVRLALAPIKLAWRTMHENYEDVWPLPKIKQSAKPKAKPKAYDTKLVACVLDWLKLHKPDIWPIAMLQALAGLRVYEAIALRIDDVALDKGMIVVTDTESHDTKTEGSVRILPICKELQECLKQHIANQKVRPATGELFLNEDGELWCKDSMVLKWARMRFAITLIKYHLDNNLPLDLAKLKPMVRLKKKEQEERDRLKKQLKLIQFQSHRLRAFFATTTAQLGTEDRDIQAYMGHVAADVLGKHYLEIKDSRMQQLARRMDGWRALLEKREDEGASCGAAS